MRRVDDRVTHMRLQHADPNLIGCWLPGVVGARGALRSRSWEVSACSQQRTWPRAVLAGAARTHAEVVQGYLPVTEVAGG